MTRTRTVILDLDGPLLDGRRRHYAVYQAILRRHGYCPLDGAAYWEMKRERHDRRRQLAASGAEALYDDFLRLWLESIEQPEYLALDRVQTGAIARLASWKAAHKRLVLATQRRHGDRLREQLQTLGLDRYLDHVVVGTHAEGGQGKARGVRALPLDARPDECLWVGDTEVDVEAARALGCPIWAVWCGLRTKAYLASLNPDYLSADLTRVSLEG